MSSLQKFEIIICAGLESPHPSRTQQFVDFWKSTKTVSDTQSPFTRMGQAFSTATARLSAPVQLPQTAVQVWSSLLGLSITSFNTRTHRRPNRYHQARLRYPLSERLSKLPEGLPTMAAPTSIHRLSRGRMTRLCRILRSLVNLNCLRIRGQ